jgi:hypothetical protein
MKLPGPNAQFSAPDGKKLSAAIWRITHLGTGLYQADLTMIGHRNENATSFDSFAMNAASPLILDEARDIIEFVSESIKEFQTDVRLRLNCGLGKRN